MGGRVGWIEKPEFGACKELKITILDQTFKRPLRINQLSRPT